MALGSFNGTQTSPKPMNSMRAVLHHRTSRLRVWGSCVLSPKLISTLHPESPFLPNSSRISTILQLNDARAGRLLSCRGDRY